MVKAVSKALIKNKNGKYLLLYRGDTHPNFPGHLDLPGGEVESEETSKTATAREIQEETGICIYPNDLKKLFFYKDDMMSLSALYSINTNLEKILGKELVDSVNKDEEKFEKEVIA